MMDAEFSVGTSRWITFQPDGMVKPFSSFPAGALNSPRFFRLGTFLASSLTLLDAAVTSGKQHHEARLWVRPEKAVSNLLTHPIGWFHTRNWSKSQINPMTHTHTKPTKKMDTT